MTLVLLLPLCNFGYGAESGGDETFTDYSENFLEALWHLYPENAVRVGRYEFAGELVIDGEDRRQQERTFWQGVLADLQQFDPDTLSSGAASDWYMIQGEAESALWYLDQYRAGEWDASTYNLGGMVGYLLNTDYAELAQRLLDINDYLQSATAYYAQARSNLDQLTWPHTRLAIQQNQGTLELLQTALQEEIEAARLSSSDEEVLRANVSAAQKAISDYVEWLQQQLPSLEDGLARDFRIGKAMYDEKFAHDIKSSLTAEEVYSRALDEKERLHSEMSTLARQLWPEYFPERQFPDDELAGIDRVITKISEDHATPAGFVNEVRAQIPALVDFIVEHDLLSIDPEKPLVVRPTPEYDRGYAVASIEAPGPYDTQANTWYNVEPLDDYAAEDAESFLREYNSRMMQILNIHEAVPGHYTQLVHANQSPSLIKSIFGNGTMIEGWAVYTERMMLEAGYGDFEPELWLMWYKWNLRTVVNTILDYQIQVEGLSEEDAIQMLTREAFQEEAEAVGKWRRATLSQVQLASYFTGYAEIYAFQQEQREQLGEDFDLKAFHDTFLSFGSAPIPVIRELMTGNE